MKPKVVTFTEKENQLHYAKLLYPRNPAVLEVLREFRTKIPGSYRDILKRILKRHPKMRVSVTTIMKYRKDYPHLIVDNKLFKTFLEGIGMDQETLAKEAKNKIDTPKKLTKIQLQKEKDTKLEEEMKKARIIIQEMNNPDLGETQKWKLAGDSRRQVDAVNKAVAEGGLPKAGGVNELFDVNGKLLAKGKEIILQKLDTIDVKHMGELKALSDILDTAFKQNRLIEGKSTDNVAVGVHSIYDKIIENANNKRENGNGNNNN